MDETRKAVAAVLGSVVALLATFWPGLEGTTAQAVVQGLALVLTPVLVWAVPNVIRAGGIGVAENVVELAREALELRARVRREMADPVTGQPRPVPLAERLGGLRMLLVMALPLGLMGCGGLATVAGQLREHPELAAAELALVDSCRADPATRALAEAGVAEAYRRAGIEPAADRAAALVLARCGPTLDAPLPELRP